MKKLFLILLTIFSMSGIWSFAQTKPTNPEFKQLKSPIDVSHYWDDLYKDYWNYSGYSGWQKYWTAKKTRFVIDSIASLKHDSITIAPGSTGYFEVNYPQIFSGQKLIDSLGVINTNIAGKAPAFSGTANYIPKFGSGGATIENSSLTESGGVLSYANTDYSIFQLTSALTAARLLTTDGYTYIQSGTGVTDSSAPIRLTSMFGTHIYAEFSTSGINTSAYKLSGVDLYSSLTANTLEKWDGSKHLSIANASGYLHNDGTGNMSFTSIPSAVTSISAGNGMNFTTITGTGSVVLGTPTTLTASTTNAVTTTSHTHRITGFLPLTGGTLTGAVTSNNSFTGTNFILSSDKRLKQGIRTLTNTDWVERIKFVRYEMKSNPEIERYGVIAQDVEEVNKYLVYTDENGVKSVSYIDLLIAKIANLEKRISELENKKKRHEK